MTERLAALLSLLALGVATAAATTVNASAATPTQALPSVPATSWTPNGSVDAVAVTPSTIYVGGNFTFVGGNQGHGVSLSRATGVPAVLPKVDGRIFASVPDGSGGWYIGGQFGTVGQVAQNGLAHINADGTVDTTFNPGYVVSVGALVLSGSTLYVGGNFSQIGGQTRNDLAAVDATSGAATSFNPNVNGQVDSLLLSGSTLYVGGEFSSVAGQPRSLLAAVDTGAGTVTSWNPSGSGSGVYTLTMSGTTLYAGGLISSFGGQTRDNAAAFDTTSGNLTSWLPEPDSEVMALAASGSVVYVGGSFHQIGAQSRAGLAAVDATTGVATAWNPSTSASVDAIKASGSTVYVAGHFSSMGGQPRTVVAALDAATANATSWNTPGAIYDEGSNDIGYSLSVTDTNVYLGGAFTSVGGAPRNNLAAFNRQTLQLEPWAPTVDRRLSNGSSPALGQVSALDVVGSTVYIGGSFPGFNLTTQHDLVAVDATSGALLNWTPDLNDAVDAITSIGSTIYVGGKFSTVDGMSRPGLAALDGVTGALQPWNPQPQQFNVFDQLVQGQVYALAAYGSNIVVGGNFAEIGGQSKQSLAQVDGTTGNATSWTAEASTFNFCADPNTCNTIGIAYVSALATSGSTLYVGGRFNRFDGLPRSNFAAIDLGSAGPTAFDADTDQPVDALAALGSNVYVGGSFVTIGGQARNAVAAVDGQTGAVQPWNPSPSGIDSPQFAYSECCVTSLAAAGDALYVGGGFTDVGPLSHGGFAVFAPPQAPTTLTYTGPMSANYGDSVTLSAVLTDATSQSPISGEPLTLGVGPQSCSATTDTSGTGSCVITATPDPAGSPYPVSAQFGGDVVYAASSDLSHTFTIIAVPALSIANVTVTQGSASAKLTQLTLAHLPVTLSKPSSQTITVAYATGTGSAVAGEDYVATSGTLTIPAGQTSATIAVTIRGEWQVEPDQTVPVILSSPTSATIANGTGLITIHDNNHACPNAVVRAVEHALDTLLGSYYTCA